MKRRKSMIWGKISGMSPGIVGKLEKGWDGKASAGKKRKRISQYVWVVLFFALSVGTAAPLSIASAPWRHRVHDTVIHIPPFGWASRLHSFLPPFKNAIHINCTHVSHSGRGICNLPECVFTISWDSHWVMSLKSTWARYQIHSTAPLFTPTLQSPCGRSLTMNSPSGISKSSTKLPAHHDSRLSFWQLNNFPWVT